VIARTSRAVAILRERSGRSDERFVVVVNGKDPEQFHPLSEHERIQVRTQLGLPAGAPLLVYVGSIGPQYEPRFMLEVFARVLARAPDSRLMVLTSQLHQGALRATADNAINERLLLLEASAEEVPALLGAADVGLAFRRPSFSQEAVAPIKVVEYLLCGLPVAYSSGVGDLDVQLDGAVSVAIERTDPNEAARVARWFLEEVLPERERHALAARRLGVEHFSLEAGAEGYRRAFALARRA
jgi:glycosyltransferase involved in cell wall biosynthesis